MDCLLYKVLNRGHGHGCSFVATCDPKYCEKLWSRSWLQFCCNLWTNTADVATIVVRCHGSSFNAAIFNIVKNC